LSWPSTSSPDTTARAVVRLFTDGVEETGVLDLDAAVAATLGRILGGLDQG
jgi:hypothetical protein